MHLMDFKELSCHIKGIMIEEMLEILQMARKKNLLWKFLKRQSQLMKSCIFLDVDCSSIFIIYPITPLPAPLPRCYVLCRLN